MPISPPILPKARRVEIVAFPDFQLLDVTGPFQVFASAGNLSPGFYDVRLVACKAEIRSSSGLSLIAEKLPLSDGPIDTLIISGGNGVHAATNDRELTSWLRSRSQNARRVASICTGAFLLSSIGALDGKRAVTHWMDCRELAKKTPKARIEVDPIFIQDGNIWTSAGVTAGIDLALAMVQADLGHKVAMEIARDLVIYLMRQGGQSQFSKALLMQKDDSAVGQLIAWMADHLDSDLSVGALARQANMSERTLARKFLSSTGDTPSRAVEQLRLEVAQRLIEENKMSLKQVADHCGFRTEEIMRRSFQRRMGVSPSEYRHRFGA